MSCLVQYWCVFTAVLLVSQVNSSTYFILPSTNDYEWCPDVNLCFSLSEVAAMLTTANISGSNVSLILAPGNHSLITNLTVEQIAFFTLISEENSLAFINCQMLSKFEFLSVKQVHIQGIGFSGCLGNNVTSVDEFIIEDCTFITGNNTVDNLLNRTLFFTLSNIIILNSVFLARKHNVRKGAIFSFNCNIVISNSNFLGFSAQYGGAIYCEKSKLIILNSEFTENSAAKGGAVYCFDANTLIYNSSFTSNRARNAGVLYIEQRKQCPVTMIIESSRYFQYYLFIILSQYKGYTGFVAKNDTNSTINNCTSIQLLTLFSNFTHNGALNEAGVADIRTPGRRSVVYIIGSYFAFNVADVGGVFHIHLVGFVVIQGNCFRNNDAHRLSGVGHFSKLYTLNVKQSEFYNNQVEQHDAGVFRFDSVASGTIQDVKFCNNSANKSGGSLLILKSRVKFIGLIEFNYNLAQYGGAINSLESDIQCFATLKVSNNVGSAIYLSESELLIGRTVTISNNTAIKGGGLHSINSKIVTAKNGKLNMMKNRANDSGGGIYLYSSKLAVDLKGRIHVYGNTAKTFGGGIHCISSKIAILVKKVKRKFNGCIKLENNSAYSGGGICLEASSKFYINRFSVYWLFTNINITLFINNTAYFGGAIFVADNTTSGTCASGDQGVQAASLSQCFVQIVTGQNIRFENVFKYPHIGNVFLFTNNTALVSGAKLFGGLLDRCTINTEKDVFIRYSDIFNSFSWILDDVTSAPIRVCFCNPNSNAANCTYIPKVEQYRKGSNFTLRVAALDQVNDRVSATILGSMLSQRGHLGDRQQAQEINATCTDLNFSIFSPLNESDQLELYAEGPCNNIGISSLRIDIEFAPCWCPIGFEPDEEINDRCICKCHHMLKAIFPFIKSTDCNSETLLLARHKDFWIAATNTTFISYQHCPYTYCHPSTFPVYVDFTIPKGADVQCAFNHTGVLCGKCQPNLTLSLGSSQCIECQNLWPLITAAVFVGVFTAGLVLVALILVLNFTVAKGTLNAMIFYANVLATNQQQFMPFSHPNFHIVFVSWLNFDVGFDVCFFEGLDAYTKAWLHLMFPVYVILIVVAVIVVSSYSRRFSRLIARKNPVAALATLILLSYAKLLQEIIVILSPANLRYTAIDKHPNAFTKVVWLHDGSINYLKSKHIPLFLVAVLIVTVGFVYTFLLLSWQWLVRFSHKSGFHWVRNTKLSSFMDAYHAPYTARNRYWTGLLLLARVILYLTAAMNVSGEPSVNLLVISLVISCVSLLHVISGISIYKKWALNVFEFVTFFNILTFVISKFYIQQIGGSHSAVAYISITLQIVVFFCSLLHHFVIEFDFLDKVKNCKYYKNRLYRQNLRVPLLDNQCVPLSGQSVTTTEVSIKKSKTSLKINSDNEDDSERKELTELLEIETSQ